MQNQTKKYEHSYAKKNTLKWLFRFDVHYRCKRLAELFRKHRIDIENKRIMDFGFGGGQLLKIFPKTCSLTGADVSRSGIERARQDPDFRQYKAANFVQVKEDGVSSYPKGPFDIIVTSHTLEHVLDDLATLRAMYASLKKGGILAVFVPVEEPDYIQFHVRNYSVQGIGNLVARAGFEVVHHEGSMYVNGHLWKLITIPSRRHWPVIGQIVNGIRVVSLSLLPYPVLKLCDRFLYAIGVGARQACVIAR
ncbi:MAG TPA: class I SAM-dependent methyltransferase [Spirochaetota bacterium]|nr:class I SAM-dependent methyltransferase [Spirochaetota bacterium]HPN83491.1 class I SAM-dependent methyltransferase [Spirochaetota bacterium]